MIRRVDGATGAHAQGVTGVFVVAVGAVLWLAAVSSPAGAISSKQLITPTGQATGDGLGRSVSSAGDVNWDGYADVIVGAPNANSTAGAVYIYFGGPGAHSTPDVILTGEIGGDNFGWSVASLGDVNGDGRADVIVGGQLAGSGAGRAYVFYGGPSLVSKGAASADVILTGEASGSAFGYSVSAAGDVNGDGKPDVFVGAPSISSGAGRAYVFYGGSGLVSKGAASADVILTGEASSAFGASVSTAGDVNGDGRADVIVGAYSWGSFAGKAYVFYGGANLYSKSATSADVAITGENAGDYLGVSVAGAGDLNGDGRADVIVGADHYGTSAGRAYACYGGPNLSSRPAANADVILTGETANDHFGESVSTAGDVNGDGRADVIVGAYGYRAQNGRAYVFYGGSSFFTKAAGIADQILTSESPGNRNGIAVAGAGDFNGDGYADVIVGADAYNGGSNAGRAYVTAFFPYQLVSPNGGELWAAGQPQTVRWSGHDLADVALSVDGGLSWVTLVNGVGGLAENTTTVLAPAQVTRSALVRVSYSGQSVSHSNSDRSDREFSIVPAAIPTAASKLQASATGLAAGDQLGFSVSAAGDVNGDGYADVIEGAPGANGGAGVAYIYFGGPGAHSTPDVILSGEGAGNFFGVSVAMAGDVNGDGRPDVIVGAFAYGSNAGRAYIFYGGPGLVSKGAASADVILTGETMNNFFGVSVSAAGDVNGDGRADVIVGAYGYNTNTGRAYVFYGGPGLVSKSATGADVELTGEAANQQFGISVCTAGDVNGDGRADVIVGASKYSSSTGRAYVFYGGSGLTSRGAASADVILTGEGTNNSFGISVSTARDLNGDGRADVIVGASGYGGNAGRAYVFYGGPGLVSTAAASAGVILGGENAGDRFGCAVTSGGDVNGDGWGDVIVGAFQYASSTGRAYVFYGGQGLVSKGAAGADAVLNGEATSSAYGASVAAAGDVNGDGFTDVVVGGYGYGGNAGRAYLYDFKRYQLLAPVGGETWNVGATKTVSWLGAEPADVSLSTDGGATYELLEHAVGGAARNSITERVPHVPTRFARIMLAPSDPQISGVARSDSFFTIQTSIALLSLSARLAGSDGAEITWSTNPGIGADGIAGYRLYRLPAGSADNGTRIGPDLILATSYVDPQGDAGSSYRLSGVNGLGEELELGRVSLGAVRALMAWPLPYRGGEMSLSFMIPGIPGAAVSPTEVGMYDLTGRLVRTLAKGTFSGGIQTVKWDGLDASGRRAPIGVYIVRAVNNGKSSTLKFEILR